MSESMWSPGFWRATAERVIASVAGGALSVLGGDLVDAFDADWTAVAAVALGAGVVALLKALVTNVTTGGGGPGITGAEILADQVAVRVDRRSGELMSGEAARLGAGVPVEVRPAHPTD